MGLPELIRIQLKLDKAMKDRGITQLKLARLTGIRQATISDMVQNKRGTINLRNLERIIQILNIRDMSEIIELVDDVTSPKD